jgi:GNAT superfamily N-acetyltransferase
MVPLRPESYEHVRQQVLEPEGPGLLALRHALLHGRPGLWGDDAVYPRSVVLLRTARDQRRSAAFGAGEPEPAVAWLVGRTRRQHVALAAPEPWGALVDAAVGAAGVMPHTVRTWYDPLPRPTAAGARPTAPVHRLGPDDEAAFLRSAPDWALQGWDTLGALLRHGAAFGVRHGGTLIAVAWILEQSERYDALGAFSLPAYRRLGLARAATRALIDHIVKERRRTAVWSARDDNEASIGLARALGFRACSEEPVYVWPADGGDSG